MIDELEPLIEEGGLILDWHTCDAFPERWVDLVVVLRCKHTLLWERLEKRWGDSQSVACECLVDVRNYPLKKIQENNESEIMQTVLEEARESYASEIVVELESESVEQMEQNVGRIVAWIEQWRKDHD